MQPEICHRCGYRGVAPGETRCPRDGLLLIDVAEHERAPRDLYLGTLLGGKYPILGVIGEGGMGAVYRSVQPMLGRDVAIKVILPKSGFRAEEAKERFLREARTIASLDHPSVVTLYDFGVEGDGTLYMVMEYVAGATLPHWLADQRPSAAALVQVSRDVLDALDAAHEEGIIHRDIKPDNIMVLQQQRRAGTDLRVKILDFGLVKLLGTDNAGRATHAGTISGSPHYMSPEQARGAPVDTRSDIYSLGTVMYEALSGHPPFQADNLMRLITMRVETPAPRLPAAPHIPEGLAAVVHRAMLRQPSERFPTAAAMRAALQALDLGPGAPTPLPVPHFLNRKARPASSGARARSGASGRATPSGIQPGSAPSRSRPPSAAGASGPGRYGSAPPPYGSAGGGSGPALQPGSGPRLQHASGPRLQHASGPALQHGSGPALQHGSGPALQHGSGPALQHGSGPALQHGGPLADEPPPLPGSAARPLAPPPVGPQPGDAPAVIASGRFAAPALATPAAPPSPFATPPTLAPAPELPTRPQAPSPGRSGRSRRPGRSFGVGRWILGLVAVTVTGVLLGGGLWLLRAAQPPAPYGDLAASPDAGRGAEDAARPVADDVRARGRHTLRSVPEAEVFDQHGERLGSTPLSLRVRARKDGQATYQLVAEGYDKQLVRLPLDGRPHTRTLWLQRPAPQRPATPPRRPPAGRGVNKREF